MTPHYTEVAGIIAGKIEFQLRVRVIHFWTLPDRNNTVEEGSLHMLLLDEKVMTLFELRRRETTFLKIPFLNN